MGQLVDSDVLIALERRGESLDAITRAAPDEPVALASITISELLVGMHRANTLARRIHRATFIESLVAAFPVISIDLATARVHAQLWVALTATGQTIGSHDMLIAATALAYDYAVLTMNARAFRQVPGLVVRQPAW